MDKIRVYDSSSRIKISKNNIDLFYISKLDEDTGVRASISVNNENIIISDVNGNVVLSAFFNDFILPLGNSAREVVEVIDGYIYNYNPTPPTTSDNKVKVSSNDTTPDFLISKIVAGTNVTIDEINDGSNETLRISSSGGGGGGTPTLRNVSSTDTFSTANETINCTSGTFTVNLPTAVGIQGTVYTLVNSGTGTITLDPNGSETINGSTTIEIKRQYVSRAVQSDGSNWIII